MPRPVSLLAVLPLAGLLPLAPAMAAKSIEATAHPGRGRENPQGTHFRAARDGAVQAWFAGSDAGYTSWIGLLVNGRESGVTGLVNKETKVGRMLDFGKVARNDRLTFYLKVKNTGDIFYSDTALNHDGFNHAWVTDFAGDGKRNLPAGLLVAFEDLRNGGDRDYDDYRFIASNIARADAVPEPSTWIMLIAGFGLVGLAARRRSTPGRALA